MRQARKRRVTNRSPLFNQVRPLSPWWTRRLGEIMGRMAGSREDQAALRRYLEQNADALFIADRLLARMDREVESFRFTAEQVGQKITFLVHSKNTVRTAELEELFGDGGSAREEIVADLREAMNAIDVEFFEALN